jgi:hypothetical protein
MVTSRSNAIYLIEWLYKQFQPNFTVETPMVT